MKIVNKYKMLISTLTRENKHAALYCCLTIIIANILFYLPILFKFPNFWEDDYAVFAYIKENINFPISLNPNVEFFLFLRPVSYFFLWIYYNIWSLHPLYMKMASLAIHITSILLLYGLILEITRFFKTKIPHLSILLCVLVVSFHPDSSISILWISDITELLGVLFYTICLFLFFKYLNKDQNNLILMGMLFFYFLAIGSKQQPLHFPLLVLFITYLVRDKIPEEKFKALRWFSLVGITVMVIYSITNYLIYGKYTNSIVANLWKKPFSIAGIAMYILFPLQGQSVYNFFLLHKSFPVIILFLSVIVTLHFCWKSGGKKKIKSLVNSILFMVIIFYPRMSASGQNRINSVQILWLFVIILFAIWYNKRVNLTGLFAFLLLFYSISSLLFINKEFLNRQVIPNTEVAKDLLTKISDNKKYYIVTVPTYCINIPYYLYYLKNHDFGKLTNIVISGITANNINYNEIKSKMVFCSIKNNELHIKALSENICIYNTTDLSYQLESKNGRGLAEGYYKIPNYILMNGYRILYHNGMSWENLSAN